MEKRKIRSAITIRLAKNIIGVFLIGGLFSCISPNRNNNVNDNMVESGADKTDLLERILEHNKNAIGPSEQILLVTNDEVNTINASILAYEWNGRNWSLKFPEIPGSVGGNGFSHWQEKQEGDNTSPTGIFGLGPVFGYAEQVDSKMEYRQATENDYWIDDPQADLYNQWVTLDTPPTVSYERMKRSDDLYKLGIVVQYNTGDVVPGNGSAIFVHIEREPGAPTAGCVAMPEASLERIIRWLDPEKKPLIIMGTVSELEEIKME